jgi:hypothetical protein
MALAVHGGAMSGCSANIHSSNGDDDSTSHPNLTSTAPILSYNNSTRTDNTELDGAVSGLEVTYVHTRVPGNTPSFLFI